MGMGARILVVEDERDAAENIRDVLTAAGYEVPEIAPSCDRALEAAERLSPALVLMDVHLAGGVDGIETARRLRAMRPVPIVYLTGDDADATLARAKETDPLGYLRKPFSARELRMAIEIAIRQHALEQALAARERWFATTLRSIADGVIAMDRTARVTFLNTAAEHLLRRDATEALGVALAEVIRLPGVVELAARAMDERTVVALPPDAKLDDMDIEGRIAPLLADGGATGAVMVLRDVREERRLARRLAVAERSAALGTMAAGMQHEINNPLAVVVANVHVALDRAKGASDAELVEVLEDAKAGAERVRRTLSDLRAIAGTVDRQLEDLELAAVVDHAVEVAAYTVEQHARVTVEHAPAPRVRADRGQLTRVFVSLLLETAQAAQERGAPCTIGIVTGEAADGRAVAELRADVDVVPRDALARAFEPFATGRPQASAGLRLALCRGIAETFGAEIEARAHGADGTAFVLTLPRASSAVARASAPRRARVLVVDDEAGIGKAIRRMLDSEHDVTIETDAASARDLLASERFDVVFCDLMMPGMTGMELHAAMAPEVAERFVFVTGGAFSPRSKEFLRTTKNATLEKPFGREEVLRIIDTMLR